MNVVDLIRRKRDGLAQTRDEIHWLIEQYVHNQIPDYQIAAWLMAVVWQGMDAQETSNLTLAMVQSGEQLKLNQLLAPEPVVDKHSTGGVGDKVTLAVAPLLAACGVTVGKMSGRGLGHSGGTIDKLESIDGFQAELTREHFLDLLSKHHIVLAGQSSTLAPADGKLYSLRDVTATVESVPLIASSIMSKKLALGCSHLLLDVKFGSGAFMKTIEQARALAQRMVDIGKHAGMHTVATITSMEQPLGQAVGNALEIKEAIEILKGEGPSDVAQLCYHETAELLMMTGFAHDWAAAEAQIASAIQSGRAVEKLAEVVEAQGGNRQQIEDPSLLPTAPVKILLSSPHNGYIAAIQAEQIGIASMKLGAGRFRKDDKIDHSTGLKLLAKVGQQVRRGEPLIEIHARTQDEAEQIQAELLASYIWSEAPIETAPLILDSIHP